jgi:hypothetical protein
MARSPISSRTGESGSSLPFGATPIARVRLWMAEMVKSVEASEVSPKTIHNARPA